VFVSGDPDREDGMGHARTFVYGQISSAPEGDGKATYLISEVCMIYRHSCWWRMSVSLDADVAEDYSLSP